MLLTNLGPSVCRFSPLRTAGTGFAAAIIDVDRNVVSDRAAWPNLVVVSMPVLQVFRRICKRRVPVGVQAHCAELAVERFYKSIFGRLVL